MFWFSASLRRPRARGRRSDAIFSCPDRSSRSTGQRSGPANDQPRSPPLRRPRRLARRVAIDTRRRLLPERLMGTFLVVVAHEGLEAAGLSNEVALSWSHGL